MSKSNFNKFTISDEDGMAENVDDRDSVDSFVDQNLVVDADDDIEEDTGAVSVDEKDEQDLKEDFEENSKSSDFDADQNETEEAEDISFTPFVAKMVEEGVLFFDENKEYEDSEQGLIEIFEDTVNHKVEEWKSSLSDLSLQLIEYIENNGTVEGFVNKFQETKYSEVDLDDEDNQKSLVEEHLLATGLDADEVKETLRDYEDSGILERQAKIAQKYLSKQQELENERFIENQRQQKEREEFERQAQMEEFENDIMNNNFQTLNIPKAERQKFLEYLTKPVTKDGKTKYLLEDSYEDRIRMAYMKFKKFDFGDIEKKATTKATLNLKKELSRFTDKNATRHSGISREEQNPDGKLNIPDYFSNMRGIQEI
jgi:hypothetical protein